ncbi:MAG: glycosyltransferase family 4 protein [Bacteroidota bacterium]|nr:glycosyltransferase family 4 protein [Bacteroidota bacterium]
MTILVINWQDKTNPLAGGAETHLHEIFSRIVRWGHHVILLCCHYPGAAREELLDDGIYVIRRGTRALFNFIVPIEYRRVRKRFRIDLVIDDINKIPFWTPLYVREPLLCISHHFFGESIFREVDPLRGAYVYLSERLVPLVYRRQHFAVVSESTRAEFIEHGFSSDQLSVIPNGIDHTAFPFAIGEKAPFPMVTYFGRIKRYKCPDHLLKAFVPVVNQLPDARLYFVGEGDYLPALKHLAQKLGIASHVVWTGRVSEREKISLLSQSWCVVNTSMKEGWGITVIESNACGTPVIAANVPGLRDAVSEGHSGLLYRFGDIEELSQKLLELLTNTTERHALSLGAVEWAQQFSWDRSAQQMLELCGQVSTFCPRSR